MAENEDLRVALELEKGTIRVPIKVVYLLVAGLLALAAGQALDVSKMLPWASNSPMNCEVLK